MTRYAPIRRSVGAPIRRSSLCRSEMEEMVKRVDGREVGVGVGEGEAVASGLSRGVRSMKDQDDIASRWKLGVAVSLVRGVGGGSGSG